ncbi:MAG: glutathione S-transferase family protein [Rhodospirillaceae bacterium]|jgi:glutathione S-transferase|nr:glutathione S-transferase family protein [Rhodospirillaceae bacterium]MBT5458249.1 glutathione S-transferase family protein [Rhodospirillaceae bacterium]
MEIVLYYAPVTCALAPYISLTEAKAEFEVRPLNFRKQQHMTPEYMAINPKHKVPLLMVDGETLTESVAIQSWIADRHPEANILPQDPWQRLQAVSLLSWCSGGIHPYLARINNPAKVCDAPGADESVREKASGALAELFGIADERLAGRDYFFDHFTAPDAHFFWCQRRARQFEVDLTPFPNVMAHFDRMLSRDSVKTLLAFEKSVQEQFASAA